MPLDDTPMDHGGGGGGRGYDHDEKVDAMAQLVTSYTEEACNVTGTCPSCALEEIIVTLTAILRLEYVDRSTSTMIEVEENLRIRAGGMYQEMREDALKGKT